MSVSVLKTLTWYLFIFTNKHMYQMVYCLSIHAIPMTLSDLQTISNAFCTRLCSNWQRASRGPSAIAEFLEFPGEQNAK